MVGEEASAIYTEASAYYQEGSFFCFVVFLLCRRHLTGYYEMIMTLTASDLVTFWKLPNLTTRFTNFRKVGKS